MSSPLPYKIDTHTHMLPSFYREALIEKGHANPDGMPYVPEWSPEAHLELMDQLNIKRSILSISSPGTHLVPGDNELAANLSRQCNEYAADLKKRIPDRFGYFASLPIPNVETCLREIELASAEGCDGFVILTNSHGVYPSDEILDPVFDELNSRSAVVFFHPTTPMCPCSPSSPQPMPATPFTGRYPNPMFEFLFDTARTLTHLFLSGTVTRCPNIKFIFSHLGGAMPPLLSRFSEFANFVPVPWEKTSEVEVRERRLGGKCGSISLGLRFRDRFRGCLLLVDRVIGCCTADPVKVLAGSMDEGVQKIFSKEEIEDICHGNAERLLNLSSST